MSPAHQTNPHARDETVSIPPEILAHVFWLAIDPELQGFLDTREPPWSTSQVCRRWQEVSLSYGYLWAEIRVRAREGGPAWFRNTNFDSEDEERAVVTLLTHRLSTQLQRARGSPLIFEHFNPLVRPLESATLDVLWEYRSSWKHFEYNFTSATGSYPPWPNMDPLPLGPWSRSSADNHSFPVLQQFKLTADGRRQWATRIFDDFLSLFQGTAAPLLTDLTICRSNTGRLHYYPISYPFTKINFPWHQLATLSLQGCVLKSRHTAIPFVLGKLVNLRSLFLQVQVWHSPPTPDLEITTLPLLRDLHLEGYPGAPFDLDTAALVAWFRTPSLCRLTAVGDVNAAVVPALLQRSSCKLRVLRMKDISDSAATSDVLDLVPGLQDLQLYFSTSPPMFDLIRILSTGAEYGTLPLCPLLETIHLVSSSREHNVDWIASANHDLDASSFTAEEVGQIADLLEARGGFIPESPTKNKSSCLPLKEAIFMLEDGSQRSAQEQSQLALQEAHLKRELTERVQRMVLHGRTKIGICSVRRVMSGEETLT